MGGGPPPGRVQVVRSTKIVNSVPRALRRYEYNGLGALGRSARQNKYFSRLPDPKVVSGNASNMISFCKTRVFSYPRPFGLTGVEREPLFALRKCVWMDRRRARARFGVSSMHLGRQAYSESTF